MKTFKEFNAKYNSINESDDMVTIRIEWEPEEEYKDKIIKDVKTAHGVVIKQKPNGIVELTGEASHVTMVLRRSAYYFGYGVKEIYKMFPELDFND